MDCARVAGFLNPRGRLSALISVHAHALDGGGAGVLGLPDAVTVLQCDFLAGTAGAKSRKRRVVAELAAYGRLHDFAGPITILGADLSQIRSTVKARYPTTYRYLLHHPSVLEMAVSNLIAEKPELGGLVLPEAPLRGFAVTEPALKCDWRQEAPFTVWNIGPTITFDGKISVDVPAKQVERNVDPQRWDNCSKFWDPPEDATMIVTRISTPPGYQKKTNPPAPGSDYAQFETLFEHFICNGTGCQSYFNNLLQVNNVHSTLVTQPSLKGYIVSYYLRDGDDLDGCIGSTQDGCPGGTTVHVKTDQGWMEVYQEKGRTSVVTHKEIAFDNAVANGISQALLTNDELARELAELACCLKAAES